MRLGVGVAIAALLTTPAVAAGLIDVVESGGNVVATAQGSFDISGATNVGLVSNTNPSNLAATLQVARVGTYSNLVNGYLLDTPFPVFGTLGSQLASSTSGVGFGTSSFIINVGIYPAGTPLFLLPTNYVSGTVLTSTATWNNASFASLGLTTGSYNAVFNGQTVILRIGAVPEPGTWALMLIGFGAIGATMRRRRAAPSYA